MPLIGSGLGGLIAPAVSAPTADVTIDTANLIEGGGESGYTIIQFQFSSPLPAPLYGGSDSGDWQGLKISDDNGTTWYQPSAATDSDITYVSLRYEVGIFDGDLYKVFTGTAAQTFVFANGHILTADLAGSVSA